MTTKMSLTDLHDAVLSSMDESDLIAQLIQVSHKVDELRNRPVTEWWNEAIIHYLANCEKQIARQLYRRYPKE